MIWTLNLPRHYQWLSDGTTKDTNVHDDGLSPLCHESFSDADTEDKLFSLCLSVAIFLHGKEHKKEIFFSFVLLVSFVVTSLTSRGAE